MTEDEACEWLRSRWPDAMASLSRVSDMVRAEAEKQNLVAKSTLNELWSRHIVDSAQLALLIPPMECPWLDVGTGAGFPGLICAMLRGEHFILVEPRKRRAEFLRECIQASGLGSRVQVVQSEVQRLAPVAAGVLSARAVAPIDKLLHLCASHISSRTWCVFPRGRIEEAELARLRETWDMTFHVEQSVTDPNSSIAVITGVRPKPCASL